MRRDPGRAFVSRVYDCGVSFAVTCGSSLLSLKCLSRPRRRVPDSNRSRLQEEDEEEEEDSRSYFTNFFLSHTHIYVYPLSLRLTLDIALLITPWGIDYSRSRFIGEASLLRQKIGMQLMERVKRVRDIEFNVRFSSAQFRPSPTTVLKGVLNRRVVKESHRDAAYKGIPPTLPPFFFSHQRFGASICPV